MVCPENVVQHFDCVGALTELGFSSAGWRVIDCMRRVGDKLPCTAIKLSASLEQVAVGDAEFVQHSRNWSGAHPATGWSRARRGRGSGTGREWPDGLRRAPQVRTALGARMPSAIAETSPAAWALARPASR